MPKFDTDDKLGSQNSIGRKIEHIHVTDQSDPNKVRYEIEKMVSNACSRYGITGLNDLQNFRKCVEFVDMKCNDNNVKKLYICTNHF